jgi:hypothetical protein
MRTDDHPMTTLINALTCCFAKIKINRRKRATVIYQTVICVTFRT